MLSGSLTEHAANAMVLMVQQVLDERGPDVKTFLMRLKSDEGATAVEYALIAGLIAVVIVAATTALGSNIKSLFEQIVSALPGV